MEPDQEQLQLQMEMEEEEKTSGAIKHDYIKEYASNPENWKNPVVDEPVSDTIRSAAYGLTAGNMPSMVKKVEGALGNDTDWVDPTYQNAVQKHPGANLAGGIGLALTNPLNKLGVGGRIAGAGLQMGSQEYNDSLLQGESEDKAIGDAGKVGSGSAALQAGMEALMPPAVSYLANKAAPALRTISNSVLGNFLGMSESQIAALRATGQLDDFIGGLKDEGVLAGSLSREDALTRAYSVPVDDVLNQPNAIQGQKFLEQVTSTPSVNATGGATERLLRSSVAQRAQSAAGMGSRKLAEYMSTKLPQMSTPSTASFSRILQQIISSDHPEVDTDIYTQQNPDFARWYMENQKGMSNE